MEIIIIKCAVEHYYNIINISTSSRKDKYVLARTVYSGIAFNEFSFSKSLIGRSINRDRSSIYNCLSNYDNLLLFSKKIKKERVEILALINSISNFKQSLEIEKITTLNKELIKENKELSEKLLIQEKSNFFFESIPGFELLKYDQLDSIRKKITWFIKIENYNLNKKK